MVRPHGHARPHSARVFVRVACTRIFLKYGTQGTVASTANKICSALHATLCQNIRLRRVLHTCMPPAPPRRRGNTCHPCDQVPRLHRTSLIRWRTFHKVQNNTSRHKFIKTIVRSRGHLRVALAAAPTIASLTYIVVTSNSWWPRVTAKPLFINQHLRRPSIKTLQMRTFC